jgi:hypothetical protein
MNLRSVRQCVAAAVASWMEQVPAELLKPWLGRQRCGLRVSCGEILWAPGEN